MNIFDDVDARRKRAAGVVDTGSAVSVISWKQIKQRFLMYLTLTVDDGEREVAQMRQRHKKGLRSWGGMAVEMDG